MLRNPNRFSTNVTSTLHQIRAYTYTNEFKSKNISEYRILSEALLNKELMTNATPSEIRQIEDYIQRLKYEDDIVLCDKIDRDVFVGGIVNDQLIAESIFKKYIDDAFRVERKSLNWTYEDLKTPNLLIDYNHRIVEIIGESFFIDGNMNYIHGISILGDLEDGCDISIRNGRLDDITIVNRSFNSSNPFAIYTNENFVLKPGAVINFKYEKKTNNFVATGLLKATITKDDIDDIIGTEGKYVLFIDSTNGDTIDASDMTTTLTGYVDEYFKDVTDQVTQWQWFRESGKTQEAIDSDEIWKIGKSERVVHLKAVDFTERIYDNSITFICEAHIDNNKLKAKATIG